MDDGNFGCFVLIALVLAVVYLIPRQEAKRQAGLTPEQRKAESEMVAAAAQQQQYGSINAAMICPHCQSKGTVRTMPIKQKKGISGAKATAALVTFGTSVLVTGLSRKEAATQAHCDNCNSLWYF